MLFIDLTNITGNRVVFFINYGFNIIKNVIFFVFTCMCILLCVVFYLTILKLIL